ncbi:MAG TPA: hypothetical protein VJ306_23110 [Pyrinomonadaceae bacterium]|nr:hypothetical protein [Pyrinomonadaceae bacterium]
MQRLVNATKALTTEPSPEECFQSIVPNYALLFFDHLYSEYLALKGTIKQPQAIALLESLHEKRVKCELTWSDIYTFDLALIDERPLENLVRKAFDARSKYRSIAGQKEYDEYLASKPPDLTAILIKPSALKSDNEENNTSPPAVVPPPPEPPEEPGIVTGAELEIVQRVLRADIRYLLSKFYLYYAMLPMREGLREQLTNRAVKMTLIILITITILAVISLGGLNYFLSGGRFDAVFGLTGVFGITVGSVVLAGIVGGCVSMLQRIQSAPTEGDALFNLAALTNGWRGVSLSPLYGAIFAALLFVLFAAGILEGSVFPKIETVGSEKTQPAVTTLTAPASTTETAAAVATPTPNETQRAGILQVKDFLKETGPKDGVSFALLMIWSFIAGFAERLVPDTLNRLVAKTEAIQGTNT